MARPTLPVLVSGIAGQSLGLGILSMHSHPSNNTNALTTKSKIAYYKIPIQVCSTGAPLDMNLLVHNRHRIHVKVTAFAIPLLFQWSLGMDGHPPVMQNCSNLTMNVLSKNQTVAGASCPVTAGPGTLGFTGPTMMTAHWKTLTVSVTWATC